MTVVHNILNGGTSIKSQSTWYNEIDLLVAA